MRRYLWIGLGCFSVALGVAGAFLPLLPTTPFMLLAAFAFSRGSERLHRWLLEHETWGPLIINWQKNRAISRRVKVYATLSMFLLVGITLAIGVPWWALTTQLVVLSFVTLFIWTRKEGASPGA